MPPKIFISYRRADVGGWSRLIRNELKASLGDAEIVLDVQAMKPGRNFEQAIHHSLGEVDMVLALIGDEWLAELNSPKRQGKKDYMRVELETALAGGVFLIPLLIDGAVMPEPDALPDSLRELALLHAISITHTDFERDIEYVAKAIREAMADVSATRAAQVQSPASAPKATKPEVVQPKTAAPDDPAPAPEPPPGYRVEQQVTAAELPFGDLPTGPFDPLVAKPVQDMLRTLLAIDCPEATVAMLTDRTTQRAVVLTRATPVIAVTVYTEKLSAAEKAKGAAFINAHWKTRRGEIAKPESHAWSAHFPMSDVDRLVAVVFAAFEHVLMAPLKRAPKVKYGSVDFAKYPLRLPGDRR